MIRLTRFTARWLGFTALVATFTLASPTAGAYCPSYGAGMNYTSIDCYLDAMSMPPFTNSGTIRGDVFVEDESYCVNFVCAPGLLQPGLQRHALL